MKTSPANRYDLNFVVDFYVSTEGNGLDATTWMYRGRITPNQIFLSRK